MIEIRSEPLSIVRGGVVRFSAVLTDPDVDQVAVHWTHTTLNPVLSCATEFGEYRLPANWPREQRSRADTYEVGAPATEADFCVWAFATDSHGAITPARPVLVRPTAPGLVAVIELVDPPASTPFSLYADLEFSGENSQGDNLDELLFVWDVVPPVGSRVVDLNGCGGDFPGKHACLSPDRPGEYTIGLTVTEGDVSSPRATKSVVVAEDQLPCLETDPDLTAAVLDQEPNAERIFRVRVVDDGDPFPGLDPPAPRSGTPSFSWFEGLGTGPLEYRENDFPEFVLPVDRYRPGDLVTVRVEVRDRNEKRVSDILAGCGDEPLCDAGRAGCFQRVTWKVMYR